MSYSDASMPSTNTAPGTTNYELVLVGGGLQNALIALGALAHDPQRRIALVERQRAPGGNHTWCLHSRDIPPEARSWMAPLLSRQWAGYDVRFPGYARTVTGTYSAVTAERLAERLGQVFAQAPNATLLLDTGARELQSDRVLLDDGRELRGELVVDARGPLRKAASEGCGFQKFVGLELEFAAPHRVERPIVMDATVPQLGGYRFFYVLPWSPTRLLVEDTRFSPDPELDRDALRAEVRSYAARFGQIASEVREESGVLPMPWRGDAIEPRCSPLVAGYRGGFFHPATGYSFHAALRMAHHLATRPAQAVFDKALAQLYAQHVAQARYAQRLNWLLFNGFDPTDMWNVFERFYRLPDALIHRFYAMALTSTDRARILIGRPPTGFKLGSALKSTGVQLERSLQSTFALGRRLQTAAEPGADPAPSGHDAANTNDGGGTR